MAGDQMKQRRDTAAGWNTNNRVLGAGEFGLETDTGKVKFGDGSTPWNARPYINYLPLDGKAANADKLDGFDSSEFIFGTDVTETATALKVPRRTSDGGLRVTDATDNDEAATLLQVKNSIITAKQETARSASASVSLTATDVGNIIVLTNTSLSAYVNVTVPADASLSVPIGSYFEVCSAGVGTVNVLPASGVTIRGGSTWAGNGIFVYGNFGTARLLKTAANEWTVVFVKHENTPILRRVIRVDFSVPNGTFVLLPLDGADTSGATVASGNYDTVGSQYSSSTPYQTFCRRTGWYMVNVRYSLSSATPGRLFTRVAINGNDQYFGQGQSRGSQAEMSASSSFLVPLQAGDYLTFSAYQDGGAAALVSNSAYASSYMDWHWVRPL